MNLLLDTHAFLWFINGDPQLGSTARNAIEDPANVSYVSMVSLWEIAIKNSLGKLNLQSPFDTLFPAEASRNGFIILPIELTRVSMNRRLEFHHHDPFDRLLIAQAVVEQMPIVTKDSEFGPYPVRTIW